MHHTGCTNKKPSRQMTLALTHWQLTRPQSGIRVTRFWFCFCLVIILTDECDFCVSITQTPCLIAFPRRLPPFFRLRLCQMRGRDSIPFHSFPLPPRETRLPKSIFHYVSTYKQICILMSFSHFSACCVYLSWNSKA